MTESSFFGWTGWKSKKVEIIWLVLFVLCFARVPVISMLFSQLRLSSLPFSKRWAPKAAFSSMSDSLPVLSDLDIEYSHRHHREHLIINQMTCLRYWVTSPGGTFSWVTSTQLDADYWHKHIQIHISFHCHMILQDVITLPYSHNCYINIDILLLCCSDLLKGPFLLADFPLRLDWVGGDGSRDCRSKTVPVRFGILDSTCCWNRN